MLLPRDKPYSAISGTNERSIGPCRSPDRYPLHQCYLRLRGGFSIGIHICIDILIQFWMNSCCCRCISAVQALRIIPAEVLAAESHMLMKGFLAVKRFCMGYS